MTVNIFMQWYNGSRKWRRRKKRKIKKSTTRVMAIQEQKMSEMIHVKVRLARGSDTYVIRDVSAEDEGRYFCRATNAFDVKEASVDVRMLGEITVSALPLLCSYI